MAKEHFRASFMKLDVHYVKSNDVKIAMSLKIWPVF